MHLGKYLVTALASTAAVHSAPSIAPSEYSSRHLNTNTNMTTYDPSSFIPRTVEVIPSESADSSRSIFSRSIDTFTAATDLYKRKPKGGGGGGGGGGHGGGGGKGGGSSSSSSGKGGSGKGGKGSPAGTTGSCAAGTVGCTTATGQASGGGNSTKHSSSNGNIPSHLLMAGAGLAGTAALYMI